MQGLQILVGNQNQNHMMGFQRTNTTFVHNAAQDVISLTFAELKSAPRHPSIHFH